MCRWAAYQGPELFLEEIVSKPAHSLLQQARAAEQCKTAVNGDGFGLAWYGARPEPGLFRDVYPAWSDPNLKALSEQVRSGLFLAHVRASTGTAISRNNCHPFVSGRWSFMHNGQIGGFERFRRHADIAIPDALYSDRKGATDSEALFLMALAEGLAVDPYAALKRAVAQLVALSRAKGEAPHGRFACALSDGERLHVLRCSADRIQPTVFQRLWGNGGQVVASEPLDEDGSAWTALPPDSFTTFGVGRVESRSFTLSPASLAA